MRNAIKIVVLMLYLANAYSSIAQTLSNKGKEFWVGYGHHQFMEITTKGGPKNSQEMVLYFSADDQPAHVTVTVKGSTYREEYDVPAYTVIQSKPMPKGDTSAYDFRLYTLPDSWGGTNSEGLFTKHGIHIESDAPIVVYAHVYGEKSSGSTMLMPVETWGYSYVSLNSRQVYNTNGARDCFSWVYVVAKENNTRVRIIPSANTRGGQPANLPIDVDLQKGDIFQLLGASLTDNEGLDLTGTKITSIANAQGACYPIAVFSGSSRTAVTCLESDGSGDNLIQQVFPYQAWGRRYLTAPTSTDNSPGTNNMNVYRIIVRDPNTIVKKNGLQLAGIRGFYYEYQSNQADYIEADQPIQVVQYLPSADACSYAGLGDPEMMVISPIEQAIKKAGFYRNTKASIDVNYLTLIIPAGGVGSLKIDGLLNDYSYSYPHPNIPGYTVVIRRWKAEQKQCIVESDSAFTGITYGLGNAESYGYNMGTLLNNLNGMPYFKNEFNPNASSNKFTCLNTPVQLSVLLRYKPTRLQWKLSQISGVVTPSADVDVPPVLAGTEIVNGVTYYKYTLLQSYKFNATGTFKFQVLATHPSVETCNNTEEVPYVVEVKEGLKTDFDIVFNNCQSSDQIHFNGKPNFSDSTSINNWQWELNTSTGVVKDSGQKVQQTFVAGSYSTRLIAVSKDGCIADTTKSFKLSDKPAKPLFDGSFSVCEGGTITFTERSTETGIKKWYWDFGNKDTLTSANGSPQVKNFSNYGLITVKHVVYNDVCASDTAQQTVTIYARPALGIQYPAACLRDGVVQFKSNSTAPDGQAMKADGYAWDFGDSNATPANPDTSMLADPSHIFQYGTYTIKYSATTENGCAKDTIIKASFNLKPALLYPALPGVCQNLTGTVSVAKAVVTNGIAGIGIYRGPGTDPAGNFNPALAGVGVHTVWYVFTPTGGCTDSVSQTMTVYSQPVIDAGPSFSVPQGKLIQFYARANDSTGFRFSWSPANGLNDPTVLRPSLVVLNDQEYTLTATGPNDCKASDFLTVKVLKPVKVPNAFSPNGDGVNDRWELPNLADYLGATVQVFNRNGQAVFYSNGYSTPWDGSYNGKPLPVGTYYYIIDRKNGFMPLSGSVTLVK